MFKRGLVGFKIVSVFMFTCFMFYTVNAYSEVYQWKDEYGQVHFGDRPPTNIKADDISNKLDNINISTDLSSPELLLEQLQQKEQAQHEKRQEALEKRKNMSSLADICRDAKNYLRTIKGRVVFIDERGKELKVSERERQKEVIKMKGIIRQKCQ